jgi:hypothetical protein
MVRLIGECGTQGVEYTELHELVVAGDASSLPCIVTSGWQSLHHGLGVSANRR